MYLRTSTYTHICPSMDHSMGATVGGMKASLSNAIDANSERSAILTSTAVIRDKTFPHSAERSAIALSAY